MRKIFAFFAFMSAAYATAADKFVFFTRTTAEQITLQQGCDTVSYDTNEWEGVKIAVRNLCKDLKAVTGNPNARHAW